MSIKKTVEQTGIASRTQDNMAASRELAKDTQQLTAQSQALQKQAQLLRSQARRIRGQVGADDKPQFAAVPTEAITVMEACRHLGVHEHTLRRVLQEPRTQSRILEQNRRVGIYHKFIQVLPPDLVADLSVRFATRKSGKPKPRRA